MSYTVTISGTTFNVGMSSVDYAVTLSQVGQQGAAGPTGISWRGAWVLSTGYALRDVVSNNGSSYICIQAHTSSATDEPGVGANTATYWELLAEKGADGSGTGTVTSVDVAGGTGLTSSGGPITSSGTITISLDSATQASLVLADSALQPTGEVPVTGDLAISDKIVHSGDTNTAIRFPVADTFTVETSGTERLRVDSSGNVGIGTSSPQSELEVFGAGEIIRSTANNATSNFVAFYDATGRKGYFGYGGGTDDMTVSNDRSGFLRLMTNGLSRVYITSSGNVGIGTPAPTESLSVIGNITVTGTVDGRDIAADGAKLDGIEADVETTTINAQTGTAYTLALGDRGQTVTMDNASANTVTIPTNASVAFATGSVVTVIQKGAGVTTIAGATGVTVNGVSAGSGDMSAQWQGVALMKIGTNEWIASGAIGAVA